MRSHLVVSVLPVVGPIVLACGFWSAFGACIDSEIAASPSTSRLLVAWDPLACDGDYRVAIELSADDDDETAQRSVPCGIGWMPIDVPHPGGYHARIDRVVIGDLPQRVAERDLDVESPVVRWTLDEPP